ncbi:transposase [Leminorella grimontii]|uniref:Transposase n=1 Tax=Leminorella grimontii TaxID=82981 RepID=A0AAV5N6H7_9GAMM|nr:hypothetical protein GLGR_3692 [Leminorella grimontii ATCC 33999 = DSM 5078]GKX57078.1 transposase [Leminorella grimontii]GKX60160.1 transposase [Leminorella grimontii]
MAAPECKYCGKNDRVCKHGRGKSGLQRYRCENCQRTFQSKYIYQAYQPELRQEIISRYLTGESVFEISLGVKVNAETVKRFLHQEQLIHTP